MVTWAGCSPAVVTRAGCSPAAAPLRCLAAAALLLLAPQAFGQEFLLSTPQQIPILAREALPQLQTLSGNINISMTATTVEGPGDNTTNSDDPFVLFTGRMYNNAITPGVIRIQQGTTMRLRVCNELVGSVQSLDGVDTAYGILQMPTTAEGTNGFKDPNILANHLHGFMGNPGTENVPCDPAPADGVACYRGDNIFADVFPGQCTEWQYDVPNEHPLGMLWIHPHHHGAAALQTSMASVPVIIEHNNATGFDYLGTPSCEPLKSILYDSSTEVIMHLQTIMAAVGPDGGSNVYTPDVPDGPTDDAMVAISQKIFPGDPYCCNNPSAENPEEEPPSVSPLPFYTSGMNAQFVLINGMYQPRINMQAGKVYRFKLVQASTMKWMDLSLSMPGCTMGIYARDAVYLHDLPRLTDHVFLGAANRVELMIQCEAGTYDLQTGAGPMKQQDSCKSTHCELIVQDVLATLDVAPSTSQADPAIETMGNCMPQYPASLQELRNGSVALKNVPTSHYGLLNFTNPADTPNSAGCAVNGLLYQDSAPMQETIGDLMELNLENIDLHPYHHHTQPYQIVDFPNMNTTQVDNGTWQVGDYVDTLLMPEFASEARVRWIPGPVNITGTGTAVLHCHILPHEDEGCMMKTQILEAKYLTTPQHGLTKGGSSAVALVCTAVVVGGVAALVVLKRRRKARCQLAALQQAALIHDEERGADAP